MPDLTTLIDVKRWLAVSVTDSVADGILGALIAATSADFLRAIDRTDLLAAAYTEVRDGDGGNRLTLRHWPITAVTSVNIAGATVPASSDRITPGYYVESDLDAERRMYLRLTTGAFTDGARIVVAYTGGYDAAPADVAQAVTDWVVARFKGRAGIGMTAQREPGGDQVTYDREAAMPPTTAATALRYKRTWPSVDQRNDDRNYRVTRIVHSIAEKAS